MHKEIVVGTKVTLEANSRWHNTWGNPTGIAGIVIRICGIFLPYQVTWSDGKVNSYEKDDLKVLGQGCSFGELYVNIYGEVHSLGKVGQLSDIMLESQSLYVGDILEVKNIRTGDITVSPLVFSGGNYFIWNYANTSKGGKWEGHLEVKMHTPFGSLDRKGSWSLGRVHWCKEIVEGLPTW